MQKEKLEKIEAIKDYLFFAVLDRIYDFNSFNDDYTSPEDLILFLTSEEYDLLLEAKEKRK